MREVGVEGRWRPLGRGRVGDAVSGGRRRHEGAPEGWSAWGPSPPETGAAIFRKMRIWGKTTKNCENAVTASSAHLLKKSDIERPLFKRSAHTQGPPACAASFPGPSREKRRRRCILAVATEGDSTPLRSEIKL